MYSSLRNFHSRRWKKEAVHQLSSPFGWQHANINSDLVCVQTRPPIRIPHWGIRRALGKKARDTHYHWGKELGSHLPHLQLEKEVAKRLWGSHKKNPVCMFLTLFKNSDCPQDVHSILEEDDRCWDNEWYYNSGAVASTAVAQRKTWFLWGKEELGWSGRLWKGSSVPGLNKSLSEGGVEKRTFYGECGEKNGDVHSVGGWTSRFLWHSVSSGRCHWQMRLEKYIGAVLWRHKMTGTE